MPLLNLHARPFINVSSRGTRVKHHSHQSADVGCLPQGRTTSVTHSTLLTSGGSCAAVHKHSSPSCLDFRFMSFCKNRMHVAQHGNITDIWSITLFSLSGFDAWCHASLLFHVVLQRTEASFVDSHQACASLLIISPYNRLTGWRREGVITLYNDGLTKELVWKVWGQVLSHSGRHLSS